MADLHPKERLSRSARFLLAENGFATALGATLGGTFLTGLVLELGGGPFEVGLAMAAGSIGSIGMLATNSMLNHTGGSRRKLALIDLGAVRVLRIIISLLPVLLLWGASRHGLLWPMLVCVMAASFFGNSAEITRRSWISDLVEPTERGRFFARRIMIGSTVNVIIMLVGAWFIDIFEKRGLTLEGLQWVVGFGAAAGLVSWLLIYMTYEPPMAMPKRQAGVIETLLIPWQRPRFRKLLIFTLCWSLAIGFGANFFNFYMIDRLKMSYFWVALVNTAGELASVVCAPFFGAWADRVGTRKVLLVATIFKAIFPFFWIFVTPATFWLLIPINLLCAFNSAMGICWLRLSLNVAPGKNQAAYLAMFMVAMNAANAVGAVVGGSFVDGMDKLGWQHLGSIGGVVINSVNILFLTSTVLRFASIPFMGMIHEPKGTLVSMTKIAALATEDAEENKSTSRVS